MTRLPATDKQLGYLKALHRRLSELLVELDREGLPSLPVEPEATLTRSDASDLIEVMKAALERLTSDPRPAPKPEVFAGYEQTVADLGPTEAARLADPVKEGEDLTYDERELLVFSERFGTELRAEPPEQGKQWITVWKRSPNRLVRPRYLYERKRERIEYGWAWICRHPDHVTNDGRPRPVRGLVGTGWTQCMRNAAVHYYKFHREKDR